MSAKPYVIGGHCRRRHLLTEGNTYTEGTRLRCKDCRAVWKPPKPASEHLKNCPHDASEHTRNNQGYWVCRACQRERMQSRRTPGLGQGGLNKAKTHCPKKHEYTPDNTYVYKGRRHCRICATASRRRILLKSYGITLERFDAMLIAQSGRCGVCSEPMLNPHIDHDHACCPGRKSCGKCVRGLLCKNCNHCLGLFHDNIAVLRNAVNYLEAWNDIGKYSG